MQLRFAITCAVWLILGAASLSRADEPPNPLQPLERKYRLTFIQKNVTSPVKTFHGDIKAKDAPERARNEFVRLFVEEWGLYPTELVNRTGLKRIIFCTDLYFGDQRRAAVPDFEHNDLYLDVAWGQHSPPYMRRLIHHEYFHVIDWRDDQHLYDDNAWAALNAPDFKYGAGGASVQDDHTVSLLDDSQPGFLTKYAASGIEEDKAELFSHMVVAPDVVAKRAKKDEILANKVERMKQLLKSYSPTMNDEFWSAARHLHMRKSDAPKKLPSSRANGQGRGAKSHSGARNS